MDNAWITMKHLLWLFCGMACCISACGGTPPEPADLILHNARIVTLDKNDTIAEAVAIRDGKIAAVGADADIRALAGPDTEQYDLGGRTVIPGLADNHYHGIGGGPGVDLSRARRLQEVLDAIAQRAKEAGPGEIIATNSDWHEGQLAEARLPLRDDLDRAAPDHPVVVVRGGHEYILNSAALRRWRITRATPEPAGGRIGRYPDGRLNGELVDRAKELVTLPESGPPDFEARVEALAGEYRTLNAAGLTSIRYAGATPELYRAIQTLKERNRLTMRVNFLFRVPASATPDSLDRIIAGWGVTPDEGDAWLRVGGVKLGVDGGYEGGLMREPYEEPWGKRGTFYGLQTMPTAAYTDIVASLNRRGWRVATHAVGDAAIDLVLDAYERANAEQSIRGRRWVVEHGFIPRPGHFPRMRQLGLAVTAQHHLYVAGPSLIKYWGRDRAGMVTPVRMYIDEGIPVSSGTDAPVNPYNPFWTLYHFITRQTINAGVLGEALHISRLEALRIATSGYAHLTFEEDVKGSIEPDKFADLTVLSEDILTCDEDAIEDMTAVMTVVGGRVVYDGRDE